VEVYRSDVEDLVTSANELLLQLDAMSAIAQWFDRVAEYARVKRGVLAALEPSSGTALATSYSSPIREAIDLLLSAGRAQGMVREDMDGEDVLILLGFLSRLTEQEAQERTGRLLGMLLDGLRSRS
jgi:hypothetical protein